MRSTVMASEMSMTPLAFASPAHEPAGGGFDAQERRAARRPPYAVLDDAAELRAVVPQGNRRSRVRRAAGAGDIDAVLLPAKGRSGYPMAVTENVAVCFRSTEASAGSATICGGVGVEVPSSAPGDPSTFALARQVSGWLRSSVVASCRGTRDRPSPSASPATTPHRHT